MRAHTNRRRVEWEDPVLHRESAMEVEPLYDLICIELENASGAVQRGWLRMSDAGVVAEFLLRHGGDWREGEWHIEDGMPVFTETTTGEAMDKVVQAKHIEERAILEFLARQDGWATHWPLPVRDGQPMRDGMPSLLDGVPALRDYPERVLRAKLASMKRRKLIDGCECGCRGDWEILSKGRDLLNSESDDGKA